MARGTGRYTDSADAASGFRASGTAALVPLAADPASQLFRAGVVKLADAPDSKSGSPQGECGFDPLFRHHRIKDIRSNAWRRWVMPVGLADKRLTIRTTQVPAFTAARVASVGRAEGHNVVATGLGRMWANAPSPAKPLYWCLNRLCAMGVRRRRAAASWRSRTSASCAASGLPQTSHSPLG